MFGHPQFGLAKLLRKIGLNRADVTEIGVPAAALAARAAILADALRPAETTDDWSVVRNGFTEDTFEAALADVDARSRRQTSATRR